MANEQRYHPFSNGTQYMDWEASNCASCSKSRDEWPLACDLQEALGLACIGDGTISEEIARRVGYLDNRERFGWPCPEHDPPFAEVLEAQGQIRLPQCT